MAAIVTKESRNPHLPPPARAATNGPTVNRFNFIPRYCMTQFVAKCRNPTAKSYQDQLFDGAAAGQPVLNAPPVRREKHRKKDHNLDCGHGLLHPGVPEQIGEGEEQCELRPKVPQQLESIKWYLSHGNAFQALNKLHDLDDLIGVNQSSLTRSLVYDSFKRLLASK